MSVAHRWGGACRARRGTETIHGRRPGPPWPRFRAGHGAGREADSGRGLAAGGQVGDRRRRPAGSSFGGRYRAGWALRTLPRRSPAGCCRYRWAPGVTQGGEGCPRGWVPAGPSRGSAGTRRSARPLRRCSAASAKPRVDWGAEDWIRGPSGGRGRCGGEAMECVRGSFRRGRAGVSTPTTPKINFFLTTKLVGGRVSTCST